MASHQNVLRKSQNFRWGSGPKRWSPWRENFRGNQIVSVDVQRCPFNKSEKKGGSSHCSHFQVFQQLVASVHPQVRLSRRYWPLPKSLQILRTYLDSGCIHIYIYIIYIIYNIYNIYIYINHYQYTSSHSPCLSSASIYPGDPQLKPRISICSSRMGPKKIAKLTGWILWFMVDVAIVDRGIKGINQLFIVGGTILYSSEKCSLKI